MRAPWSYRSWQITMRIIEVSIAWIPCYQAMVRWNLVRNQNQSLIKRDSRHCNFYGSFRNTIFGHMLKYFWPSKRMWHMCLQIVSHYDSHYLCVIYDFSPHRTEICLAMTNWKEDCTKHHQYAIIAPNFES